MYLLYSPIADADARLTLLAIKAASLEQTLHSRGDPHEHDTDLFIGRGGSGRKPGVSASPSPKKTPSKEQRVEMDVQIQAAAKALEYGHRSRPPVAGPVSACAVALEAQQHPHGHAARASA